MALRRAEPVRNLGPEAGAPFERTFRQHSYVDSRRPFLLAHAALREHRASAQRGALHAHQAIGASPGDQPAHARQSRPRRLHPAHARRRAVSSALGRLDTKLPNFILLDPNPEGNEFKEYKASDLSGWLGPEHAPVRLGGSYTQLGRTADTLTPDRESRDALRRFFARKYENDRRSPAAAAQNSTFEKVKGLMSSADLFDLTKLPEKDRERYGPGTFGLHTLMARNLVEEGAPFVMVANGMPWDNHVLQHEIHQMLVPELDRILHNLITDLEERGLLEHTLVIAMGEFGRTPWLNVARGRDHYPNAWSMMMTGCGLKRGVVVGATDIDGVDPDGQSFNEQNLFATIFTALGIDPYAEYDLPDMPTFHRVEDHAEPIKEVLA